MKRLTLALGCALLLAGSALAQSTKTVTPSKPVTDFKPVQEHLYGLNFNVGERTGQLTPQLRTAIAQWRKNRGSAATGDMSEVEAAQLLAVPLPKVWGAIAYSAAGAHGSVTGKPSRDAAEKELTAECEKQSKKCIVVAAAGTSCAAVATFSGPVDGKAAMGAWGSYRPKLDVAKEAAMADCKKNAPLPDTCAVREAVCADGSHKK